MSDMILFPDSSVLSMTSREIAELTGKQHKNVLRDIDNLLISLGSDLSQGFSETYEGDPEHGLRYFKLDEDGQPTVTSLKVAELFEREHKNVLATIRKEFAEEIGRLELKPSSYLNAYQEAILDKVFAKALTE